MGLRGGASNIRDGSVVVLLDSDDPEKVRLYIEYLLSNPSGYYFNGRIDNYTIEDFSGPVKGDYSF